jgi:hypothetical protein
VIKREVIVIVGYRSIEMQVALPRTQYVGKIQEHLNQQSQVNQDQLATNMKQDQALKRMQVSKKDEVPNSNINKQNNVSNNGLSKDRKSGYPQNHPFKGTRVDISG